MTKPPLVCVGDIVKCTWLDAHVIPKDELSQDEVDKTNSYKFASYGILARDDRQKVDIKDPVVAIAAERGEDDRYRGVTFIPVSLVVSVERVKANQRRKPRSKKSLPTIPANPVDPLQK